MSIHAHRPPRSHLASLLVGAALILTSLGAPAAALADPIVQGDDTLLATLGPWGDNGAGGTVVVDLDNDLDQVCHEIDVTLTDLAGDPPTAIDIRDFEVAGVPLVLSLTSSVDGAGHADGCVVADDDVIATLVGDPGRYAVMVHTATQPAPERASYGTFVHHYATTDLRIRTLVCPRSIQNGADITPDVAPTCLPVVLFEDNVAGHQNPGYTIVGYGGTAEFDYHVVDEKHGDLTIDEADLTQSVDCDNSTHECTYDLLYHWEQMAQTGIEVTPTVYPHRMRLGAATATDGTDALPVTVGAGSKLTVDATGVAETTLTVYLLQAPPEVTMPTVETPIVRFRVGGQYSAPSEIAGTAPILVTLAGSDAESGLDHYTIQRRIDGHGWVTIGRDVHHSRTFYMSEMLKGHAYQFRVQAVDEDGNGSLWKSTPVMRLGAVGDNSSRIRYSRFWKHVGNDQATGDSLKSTTTAGSIARFTFRGRAVAWVAPIGPTRGSAKAYIDGKLISTVDLYAEPLSSDPDHAEPVVRMVEFTKTFSKVGTHEIVIRVLGTAGHPRVDVDAFLIID